MNNNINIIEILNSDSKTIRDNMDLLSDIYKEKLNGKVCRTCPSDINYMILRLKNFFKMVNFKFKAHAAMYKNKKGDRTTISNNTITDEKAIEFLRTNPKRIELFSEYPDNWESLLNGETEQEKDNRLAIEAEILANQEGRIETLKANGGKGATEMELSKMKLRDLRNIYTGVKALSVKDFVSKVIEEGLHIEEKDETENTELREELSRMSLENLKVAYPEIQATKVEAFINQVLKSE